MMGRLFAAVLCLGLVACAGDEADESASEATDTMTAVLPDSAAMSTAAAPASAAMRDASGRELGTLTLTNTGQGIEVRGTLTGLAPGTHGIHLHTVGRCEPDFAAAGDHWNPGSQQHARPGEGHRGDLENITVGADSSATVMLTTGNGASLHGDAGPDTLLDPDGAAVIVHASADDYQTQPSGNSGDRIACGVVQG